jgi:hypothetical protein
VDQSAASLRSLPAGLDPRERGSAERQVRRRWRHPRKTAERLPWMANVQGQGVGDLEGRRPPPLEAAPPLRPAFAARSRSWAKLRFSLGTLAPPRRAISRRRSGSIAAKPRRLGRRGDSSLLMSMTLLISFTIADLAEVARPSVIRLRLGGWRWRKFFRHAPRFVLWRRILRRKVRIPRVRHGLLKRLVTRKKRCGCIVGGSLPNYRRSRRRLCVTTTRRRGDCCTPTGL